MKHSHRVAIIGCGVVGAATAKHLLFDADLIRSRQGLNVELAAVVDLDLSRARSAGIPESILYSDFGPVLLRGDIDIVVELIGGTTTAFSVIRQALETGKQVVTANKALLAQRGTELMGIARENKGAVAFEASCGGGIPLIRSVVAGLAADRIDALYGIVNGTCNYILSEMIERSHSYERALADAQRQGLAEADPTLDVGGMDSAHKIAILACLAFGARIDLDQIPVSGIDDLDIIDVKWASRLGYVPKLLAIAERHDAGATLRVCPSFVPKRHPLAWVSGPFNAVSVYSYPTGHTMYYGRGAGGSATAGAIVSDIVSIANGSFKSVFDISRVWPDRTGTITQNSPGSIAGRFYVRAMVDDTPGILGEIASIYGRHGISLASIHQDEVGERTTSAPVQVVIVTHQASEENLLDAVSEIGKMDHVQGKCSVISIIDEPPERLLED